MPTRPILTRRRFLEHLGAVGGSSLVMTAMTSWDPMAGQAGARPALTGRPRAAKVLVLGAGVSGLVVGYELGKLGYDFRILEARDRVGGLAWTVRRATEHTEINGERQVCAFDEGLHVNVGPWRIPYTHTGVLNYCKELGVPLQIFVNEADASYFYYEGNAAGSLSNTRVRLREVKADMIGHTNELLVKAIDQRQLDLPLTAEDKQRFVALSRVGGLPRFVGPPLQGVREPRSRGSVRPQPRCCSRDSETGCDRFRHGTAPRRRPCFTLSAAWTNFPKGFQRAIGRNRITFNAEVQSVHQDEAGVKVRLPGYEEREEDRAQPRITWSSACRCRCWRAWTSTSRRR